MVMALAANKSDLDSQREVPTEVPSEYFPLFLFLRISKFASFKLLGIALKQYK